MELVVTFVGILIAGAGVVIAIAPDWFVGWISSMNSKLRFWSAIIVRTLLGVAFLLAAPSSRWPIVVDLVGILMLAAAFGILVVGRARMDAFLTWMFDRIAPFLRVGSIAVLAFGALLVYAGA